MAATAAAPSPVEKEKEQQKDKEKEQGQKRKEKEPIFPVADDDLPKAVVTRVIRNKLPANVTVSTEAKAALSRATKIFILYLTATAHDACTRTGRTTLLPKDIMQAIEETEFAQFSDPMNDCLQSIKAATERKRAKVAKKNDKAEERDERRAAEDDIEIDDDNAVEDVDDDKDEDFNDD